MKLLSYVENQTVRVGVKLEEGIFKLSDYAEKNSIQLNNIHDIIENPDLLKKIESIIEAHEEEFVVEESTLTLAPVLQRPSKIICVGLNYRKHAEESNMAIPEFPVLFNKFNNSLAAHNEEISLPEDSSENDYEAELAIVIGKETKNVSDESALNYVFGYCNANDLSSRDLQFRTNQWLLGKALDKFCPIGPYLVTADEVGNPNDLEIKTYVNGELRQNSNTSDMIFNCKEIISYISRYITLSPGDVILTGTPEGVILGLPENERVYLKPGDEMIVEIEKLGKLYNKIV
ncbi:fumarylacetoacetate hydrolase family protein [Lysinibacillus telephonicus]|uniref:fumarylacetoacetate hydrolase family protein n=1 Tax=Lysinibacillus telephonicus TaxID=1714840 RepID=UPI0031FD348F